LWAIYNGFISVTPLSMNLTHEPTSSKLKSVFGT
jgi:broad specificity polyphosphatase/5'/3'-nucleotidase SurE